MSEGDKCGRGAPLLDGGHEKNGASSMRGVNDVEGELQLTG